MKTVRLTVLSIPVATQNDVFFLFTVCESLGSLCGYHGNGDPVEENRIEWPKCSFPALCLSGEFHKATKREMLEVSKSCSNQIAEPSQPPCLTPKSIRLSLNYSCETPPPPVCPSTAVLSDDNSEL